MFLSEALFTSLIVGYLLGSIPFTQIVAKVVKGVDLRAVGSRNVGGRNVFYSVGRGWGILAGLLDFFKGIAALQAAQALGADYPTYLWAGLAAVAGHNFPVWLRFRGGKGLAVIFGLGLTLAFPEMAFAMLIGAILLWATKNISIASLAGYALLLTALIYNNRPVEILWLMLGNLGVMVAATLPGALGILRSPEGIRGYLKNPNEAYQEERN
jgi:glycerol-3-phosphate acyltransferase PlsY